MSQLDEIHELIGSIAFPETPEERDDAERKILALVREQAAKLERVEALRGELFEFSQDASLTVGQRAAYRDASRAINAALIALEATA